MADELNVKICSLPHLLELQANRHPHFSRSDSEDYHERYTQHDNSAALTDAWQDNNSSYIWRVGVLTRIDSNKSDWMHVWIGHEREPGQYDFIGHLYYRQGENDDPGRCLARALWLLGQQHPSFDIDR